MQLSKNVTTIQNCIHCLPSYLHTSCNLSSKQCAKTPGMQHWNFQNHFHHKLLGSQFVNNSYGIYFFIGVYNLYIDVVHLKHV